MRCLLASACLLLSGCVLALGNRGASPSPETESTLSELKYRVSDLERRLEQCEQSPSPYTDQTFAEPVEGDAQQANNDWVPVDVPPQPTDDAGTATLSRPADE